VYLNILRATALFAVGCYLYQRPIGAIPNGPPEYAATRPIASKLVGIDLYSANQFHIRLDNICEVGDVQAQYLGALGEPRGTPGLHSADNAETYVAWDITQANEFGRPGRVLFRITVSAHKTRSTVATVKINEHDLYVEVQKSYVGEVDKPLKFLNGNSIRGLLAKL
jgi:hypothetical protein